VESIIYLPRFNYKDPYNFRFEERCSGCNLNGVTSKPGESVLDDYAHTPDRYTPSESLTNEVWLQLNYGFALRKTDKNANNTLPYDWGNATAYTQSHNGELWGILQSEPWPTGIQEHTGPREVYYRGKPQPVNTFFILTLTQYGNLCNGTCIGGD
jgi:hypothetical protein